MNKEILLKELKFLLEDQIDTDSRCLDDWYRGYNDGQIEVLEDLIFRIKSGEFK